MTFNNLSVNGALPEPCVLKTGNLGRVLTQLGRAHTRGALSPSRCATCGIFVQTCREHPRSRQRGSLTPRGEHLGSDCPSARAYMSLFLLRACMAAGTFSLSIVEVKVYA
jgi:hypothetical protein